MRLFAYLTLAILSMGLLAAPSSAEEFNKIQKEEIEKIVSNYLLENPDIIRKVFGLLRQQDAEREQQAAIERAEKAKLALASNKEEIFNAKNQIVIGNPDGDVTLVEFLDYNCGYCKRAFGGMLELLSTDKNLRVVLKELPVLGPQSIEAARVAIAVTRIAPDKYWDFHKAMMVMRGVANKESALRVAEKLGLSRKDLEKEYVKESIADPLIDTRKLADALQINGTPAYALGDEVIPGFLPAAALKQKIKDLRSCGSTSC